MFQFLIIYRTKENESFERLSRDSCTLTKKETQNTRSQEILARVTIPSIHQNLTHILNFTPSKRRSILQLALQHTRLPRQQLNHLPHSHTRRKPMRIHNNIRINPLIRKRHILLLYNNPTNTLLTMLRGELIPHFSDSRLSQQNFDDDVVACCGNHDLIRVHVFGKFVLQWSWT